MPTSPVVAAASVSPAINRLWYPRLSLASCLRAVMARNTVGVALTEAQRFNHFPATPLCSISWWFEGESELLEDSGPHATLASPRAAVRERVAFAGPFTRPSVSWNPAPVHGMMVMLLPDAMHLLTGVDPQAWINRLVDVRHVLPSPWLAMCEAVRQAPDDDTRVQLLQDFIDPLWQAARPRLAFDAHRYQDWARGLALRAAASASGRSLRQVERRIKQWAGQPMRELLGMGRAERAFFEALAADGDGRLNWADLAAETGYADQSHLVRVTRRITGFAPQELRRRIAEDESFWAYRLWQ